MTYEEWRRDVSLASQLKEALAMPIIQKALSVVDSLTAAKALGNTNAILQVASNSHVLFGYDAGRAGIIADLHNLAVVPEEVNEIPPSYIGEF